MRHAQRGAVRLLLFAAALTTASAAKAETFTFGTLPLTVPDGFVLQQSAAVPLVVRPITCAFDDAGRLYVAESSGSNAPLAEQQKQPSHQLLRLEDTDGDGVFDERTVFADGLMMLQGTLWHDGSLYVGMFGLLQIFSTEGHPTQGLMRFRPTAR